MLTLLSFIVGAIVSTLFFRGRLGWVAPYAVAACLSVVCFSLLNLNPTPFDAPLTLQLTWSQAFGASFEFRLDGLAKVMALLISFIGTGVFLYSAAYMKGAPDLDRFYTTLAVFTAAMLGLVMMDNMISFFLFWELTSVCSFLLVGTKHQSQTARDSARKSLFITVGGGLCLLVGFLLISVHGQHSGLSLSDSLRFSAIDPSIIDSSLFPWILLCCLFGISTKSAQVPFHIWLPAAMAGPTPVSSFLHSATMVKAGVFLLARLSPAMNESLMWHLSFTLIGAATMLTGAFLSACQVDIKKILAYSTIAVLGILVMLLGIGTVKSIKAAVVFLVAHALYKAALFQIIGIIDYAAGSRNIKTLGGLGRSMPVTACAALLAVLSMAVAPPLFGFFGKEIAYLSKLQLEPIGSVLILAAVITNVLLVGLALSVFYRPFCSIPDSPIALKSAPRIMAVVPLVFALCGLFIGLFPAFFDAYYGSQMASAIAGQPLVMELKLWHGVNLESLTVVALSAITLGLGTWVAVRIKTIILFFSQVLSSIEHLGPNRMYDRFIEWLPLKADQYTQKIQHGDLTRYMQTFLIASFILLLPPVFKTNAFFKTIAFDSLSFESNWLEAIVALFILLPALAMLKWQQPLTRVLLLGTCGFSVIMLFVVWAAPDLALTQLLVEGLLLGFLIALMRSNTITAPISDPHPATRWILALCLTITVYVLFLSDVPQLTNDAKAFFMDAAYTKAFGKNVVNVILVDFRALDTFGEIIVVAIAALGCAALLAQHKRSPTNG